MGNCSSFCQQCKAKTAGKNYLTDVLKVPSYNFAKFILNIDQNNEEEEKHIENMLNVILPGKNHFLSIIIQSDIFLMNFLEIKGIKVISARSKQMELCNFLANWLPETLPLFYIEKLKFDNGLKMEPTDIQSICHVADKVTEEMLISSSQMSKENMTKIIEAGRKCSFLKFYNWEFEGKSKFELDPDLEYSVKDISLHDWWSNETQNKLTIEDLEKLIISMSKTGIKNCLKVIQIDQEYPHWKKLKKILSNNEMSEVKVVITKANKTSWKFA